MVTPSSTPPRSMLFSRQQKCSGHTSTLSWYFFKGGRGSGGGGILSEPGFRGKYSKIKHTTTIFLNIFVQDCRSSIFRCLNIILHWINISPLLSPLFLVTSRLFRGRKLLSHTLSFKPPYTPSLFFTAKLIKDGLIWYDLFICWEFGFDLIIA